MIKLNSKTNQDNVIKFIDMEITSVHSLLSSQKAFSKQILVFLKNFLGNVDIDSTFSDDVNNFISDASEYLSKINKNIEIYTNLLEQLESIKNNLDTVKYNITVSEITKYNKELSSNTTQIMRNNVDIEKFIHSMSSIDVSEYISIDALDKVTETVEPEDTKKTTKTTRKRKSTSKLADDTLIISEIDGTVTLPYKVTDLKRILRKNPEKYTSLSDIILDQYTVPLSNYKVSAVARFKEAYKLIMDREHGTKKEALKLAVELFSNYSLHPAIITACKNLNELDVYLSCLEFNELDDFRFFKIVYQSLPVVSKVKK